MPKTRILFVCLGNIIRSPLGEKLFEHVANEGGVGEKYEVDSAGTSAHHIGERPDERMRRTAQRRGFVYDGRARQVKAQDLDDFDLVIAMDLENLNNLRRLASTEEQAAKLHLMRSFDPDADGDLAVPDPWYGGPQGFDAAYDIIDRSVRGLLLALESGQLKVQ